MGTLTHAVAWRKKAKRDVDADLTEEERAHVKAALAFLRRRLGSVAALAKAMGVKPCRVWTSMSPSGAVSAGVAMRTARVARVPLEDVLSGAWPKPGACPYCGHGVTP